MMFSAAANRLQPTDEAHRPQTDEPEDPEPGSLPVEPDQGPAPPLVPADPQGDPVPEPKAALAAAY